MFDEYAQYMSDRRFSRATIKLRVGYARRFVAYQIQHQGIFDIRAVTLTDLTAFVHSEPEWKPATQQTVVASMRTFFRWAMIARLVDDNPARMLDPIRVPRTIARIAPDNVIMDAFERATEEERAMLLLGAECGLRVAEIAGLRRSSRTDRWLLIVGKGGVTRNVYMSPELAKLLDRIEMRRISDFYFIGQSGKGHVAPSTVWRHIRKLTNLNTHSLRHRAGTTVYRGSGHDLRLAQTFLGHASPNTTAIYVHIEDDDLIRASGTTRLAA